jgi:hypothetical protein
MATVDEIVSLLSRHVDSEHFVVDVKAAMKELEDPRQDFEKVLSDPSVAEWHFYALEGLRSIAGERPISRDDGRMIIQSTKGVAQRLGIDEFYKSFDALARSPNNVTFLADFVSDLLTSRDQRDWLWLAFSAMATLLQRSPFFKVVHNPLVQQLITAYEREPVSRRKPQMDEIVRIIRRRQL